MKKFIGLFITFAASNVFSQPSNLPPSPTTSGSVVEFVSLEQMPIPLPKSEIEKMQNSRPTVAADGFSSAVKSPQTVKGFYNHMNMAKTLVASQLPGNAQQQNGGKRAPEVHKDLSTLKLTFKEASFNRGKLIAAAPSGTMIDNAWTGLDRFFQIDGVGMVRLSESDLTASKGKFYMLKTAVNTHVNGKHAISNVFTDDEGQSIEEILWVHGNKLFKLTFGPEVVPSTKAKIAQHINASSLAQELH